jgi:hypothetical protein
MTLVDSSMDTPAKALLVNLFAPAAAPLPGPLVLVGDIVRLHRCRVQVCAFPMDEWRLMY